MSTLPPGAHSHLGHTPTWGTWARAHSHLGHLGQGTLSPGAATGHWTGPWAAGGCV